MGLLKRRAAPKPIDVEEDAADVEEIQKDKPKNPLSAIRANAS